MTLVSSLQLILSVLAAVSPLSMVAALSHQQERGSLIFLPLIPVSAGALIVYYHSQLTRQHLPISDFITSWPSWLSYILCFVFLVYSLFRNRIDTVALIIISTISSLFFAAISVSPQLPYATLSNNDIWSYIKFTTLAIEGSTANNIANFDLYGTQAYSQTISSIALLSNMSAIFSISPQFSFSVATSFLVSVSTYFTYKILSHRASLGRTASLVIAVSWMTAGSILLMVYFGFFAQLLSLSICVCILYLSVAISSKKLHQRLLTVVLLFYMLLLTHTSSFLVFSFVYLLMHLYIFASTYRAVGRWRNHLIVLSAPVISFFVLLASDFHLARSRIEEIVYLSDAPAGWVYGLINPVSLLIGMFPPDAGPYPVRWILSVAAIGLSALFLHVLRRSRTTLQQSSENLPVLLATFLAAFVTYIIYFLKTGETYQQWKLYISTVGLLAFVVPAAVYSISGRVSRLFMCLALVLVASFNLISTRLLLESRIQYLSKHSLLNNLDYTAKSLGIEEVRVDFGDNFESTMIAAQFSSRSKLDIFSPSYYGPRRDTFARSSLLSENCEIYETGSITLLGESFCIGLQPVVRRHQFIGFRIQDRTGGRPLMASGLSAPEAWGTWTEATAATITLVGDEHWTGALVRLKVRPFLTSCASSQRVVASVGGKEVGRWSLTNDVDQLIEFHVTGPAEDGVFEIALQLPDAHSPNSCGLSADRRQLALGLISLELDAAIHP